jgi:hypothetical protein
VPDADFVRQTFQSIKFVGSNVAQNHSHPESAANRNSATWFTDVFARIIGKRPFHFQAGSRPIRAGNAFSRLLFWVKDLALPYSGDLPLPSDVVGLTDVDYYMETPELEAMLVQPNIYVLYTMTPTTAASDDAEMAFTFLPTGEIKVSVAGGAVYQHHLHDFNHDHILATTLFPPKYAVYNVERRQTSKHHSLVCLTPICSGGGVISTLLVRWLGHTRLSRLNVTRNGWARFNVRKRSGLYVTMARCGSYAAATVTAEQDDLVEESLRTSKQLVLSEVKKLCDLYAGAMVVKNYHMEQAKGNELTVVSNPDDDSTVRYQMGDLADYNPDAQPVVVPFMNPIVKGGCYNPELGPSTARTAISERITKCIQPDKPLTEFVATTMAEFVDFIRPRERLHPVHPDQVYEKQTRPSQQRALNQGFNQVFDGGPIISAFIKREALQGFKPPRNISTMTPHAKANYSCYMYAAAEHVKTLAPYAFSRTPRAVAERIVDMARAATTMCEFDIHRMDGYVNRRSRDLERMVLGAFFKEDYHAEMYALHAAQYKNTGYVSYGKFKEDIVKYYQEYSRASGSPETSLFNTLITMYMHYLAFRLMHNGTYLAPHLAWYSLGMYGGDDGITADLDPERLQRAGAMLGFKVKAFTIKRGDRFSFLNRHYPAAWLGDPSSYSDIKRALVKFHVTPQLTVTNQEKLVQKSLGYLFSDAKTPVLGDIALAVTVLAGISIEDGESMCDPLRLRSYHSVCPMNEQYPQVQSEAGQEFLQEQLPGFPYQKFLSNLEACCTLEDIMRLPTLYELEIEPQPGFIQPNALGLPHKPKSAPKTNTKKPGPKKSAAPGQGKPKPRRA